MKQLLPSNSLALIFCSVLSTSAWAGEGTEVPDGPPPSVTPLEPGEAPEIRAAPEGLPALQMAPDFISPGLAFGGYFPTAQMESGAIRVEPFTIRAVVNAGLGYDDNVTLAATNKISSMFLTVAPSIVVGLEGANQRYFLVYRGLYGQYFSSSADNYNNHNLGIAASHDWSARLRTQAGYEFTRGQDPRGATRTAVTEPDPWNMHRVRGSVSYGAEGAPGRIEGNAAYLSRDYTNSNIVADGRNYDQVDLGGSFSYRVAPKTTASIYVAHSDISHKTDANLDATENRFLVGLSWEALAKTRGAVRVGYFARNPQNPAVADFSSFAYEAEATWSPLIYSSINLLATRSSAEATEIGSNFIVVEAATVAWNHTWGERIRSTVRALHGSQQHEGIGRTDTYNTLSARVSYAIHRRVRLGAEFRHDWRTSPDPLLEYRRNLSLFTVESSL